MAESSIETQVEAARAYEALFVPALFGQWATAVADAAQVRAGHSALDVACGTGVLTREMAARVGRGVRATGLDVNAGMLAVAREHAPDVRWHQGSAESLPFPDASFDRVVSQFGLMFVPDPQTSIREMLRVLKPAGRIAVAVWDTIDQCPGYAAEVELIERMAGTAAADAVRAPFVHGMRQSLGALFDSAGAQALRLETHTGVARFPSIRVMVEAELRGWLPVMGVDLTEEQIHEILQAAETALASFTKEDGTVAFTVRAHVVTAEKA